jgi:hypothetical protein
MRHRSSRRGLAAGLVGLVLLAAACVAEDADAPGETSPPGVTAETTVAPPVTETNAQPPMTEDTVPRGSSQPMFEPGTVDPGLQPLVERAVEDLAGRLGIADDEIELVSAVLVIWPDTSLGCPDPKMEYAQVPQDGSIIELSAQNRIYRYHTGGTTIDPFLCERPMTTPPTTIAPGGDV